MLRLYRCDFHIHTCLSPCGELEMTPMAIVEKSISEKLDIIAICDHNSSENIQYVMKSAEGKPLTVFPGIEITSSEEVHVLSLFDTIDPLIKLQDIVYAHMSGTNREELFGCQAIVNHLDEVEGFNDRLLIGATKLPLIDIVHYIHDFGGLAIASHINRETFGIIGHLGFIDPEIPFDALDVSSELGISAARKRYPELSQYAVVESSDAHKLDDIGKGVTKILLNDATVSELKMAFLYQKGRCVLE